MRANSDDSECSNNIRIVDWLLISCFISPNYPHE